MTSRRILAVAAAAVAGLGVAACVPPNENPSDVKIDTATEFQGTYSGADQTSESSAPATTTSTTAVVTTEAEVADDAEAVNVAYIDCVAEPTAEPSQVTLDCTNPVNAIVNITWDEWTEDEASGQGTNQATGAISQITLTDPEESGADLVFTTVIVDGEEYTPQA